MRRIASAITLTVLLAFAALAAQDSASPPQSSDSGSPSAEASSPIGAGVSAPSYPGGQVYKVCRQGAPHPCATPPVVKKSPDPEYSREAQKKRIEGTVVLWLIVGADGLPHNIRVARPLGYGCDEEAIRAVEKWKFKPSTIGHRPVAVQINVEVSFRPY